MKSIPSRLALLAVFLLFGCDTNPAGPTVGKPNGPSATAGASDQGADTAAPAKPKGAGRAKGAPGEASVN